MKDQSSQVSRLLSAMEEGDPNAGAQLLSLVYDQLRRIAAQHLRNERPGHTLQPTALVHEAYLRMFPAQQITPELKRHFFGIASHVMRQILVDHARRRAAAKRGAEQQRVDLDDALLPSPDKADDLVALDDALNVLGELDPRQSQIVEMKFFGGLTIEEIAAELGVAPRTVKRDWALARVWLHRALSRQ